MLLPCLVATPLAAQLLLLAHSHLEHDANGCIVGSNAHIAEACSSKASCLHDALPCMLVTNRTGIP